MTSSSTSFLKPKLHSFSESSRDHKPLFVLSGSPLGMILIIFGSIACLLILMVVLTYLCKDRLKALCFKYTNEEESILKSDHKVSAKPRHVKPLMFKKNHDHKI
jgi:hypothetical protein